jgi:hypothetical protein
MMMMMMMMMMMTMKMKKVIHRQVNSVDAQWTELAKVWSNEDRLYFGPILLTYTFCSIKQISSKLLKYSLNIIYCHVFYLHVATIYVDSPDLTRKFIWTIAEITHNRYNTHFRVW